MGRAHAVKVAVCLEWTGGEYVGEAVGTESSHSRLETAVRATLAATQKILATLRNGAPDDDVALGLDGVKVVEAFDRKLRPGGSERDPRQGDRLAGRSLGGGAHARPSSDPGYPPGYRSMGSRAHLSPHWKKLWKDRS
jgi:hypothetical protein